MIGEIFGSEGTLMGIFNSWEINRIAKGVGENFRRINTVIDISDINSEHLQNLKLSVDKITDIISAMLKHSPAQLITEIDRTLEMETRSSKPHYQPGSASTKQKIFSGSANTKDLENGI